MASIAELVHRMFNSATGALRVELVGGGGSDPSALPRETLAARTQTVPSGDGSTVQLKWIETAEIGDPHPSTWDFTDPTAPVVTVSGIWAVRAFAVTASGTGYGMFELDFDLNGDDVPEDLVSFPLTNDTGGSNPRASVGGTYYLAAGMVCALYYTHSHGSDKTVDVFTSIQQIG